MSSKQKRIEINPQTRTPKLKSNAMDFRFQEINSIKEQNNLPKNEEQILEPLHKLSYLNLSRQDGGSDFSAQVCQNNSNDDGGRSLVPVFVGERRRNREDDEQHG